MMPKCEANFSKDLLSLLRSALALKMSLYPTVTLTDLTQMNLSIHKPSYRDPHGMRMGVMWGLVRLLEFNLV
jgi:hypothetical protein